MTQTHKDRAKDLETQRREYRREKIKHRISAALALLALIVVFTGISAFRWFYGHSLLDALLMPLEILVGGLIGNHLVYWWNRATATPCALPIREQIANLPAEKVLLRGSDQPAATPDELLRAAQAGKETDTQELLRADRTQPYEQHADSVQVQQIRP